MTPAAARDSGPAGRSPSQAYFGLCEGRWAGRLDFAITDYDALRATPRSRRDRLSQRSLDRAQRSPWSLGVQKLRRPDAGT